MSTFVGLVLIGFCGVGLGWISTKIQKDTAWHIQALYWLAVLLSVCVLTQLVAVKQAIINPYGDLFILESGLLLALFIAHRMGECINFSNKEEKK